MEDGEIGGGGGGREGGSRGGGGGDTIGGGGGGDAVDDIFCEGRSGRTLEWLPCHTNFIHINCIQPKHFEKNSYVPTIRLSAISISNFYRPPFYFYLDREPNIHTLS